MLKIYASELQGMHDFWEDYGCIPDYDCNTDGYRDGVLVEFKLNDFDPEKVFSQLKRYVVARNSKALDLPRYGIGICLNQGIYQVFDLLKGNENYMSQKKGKFSSVEDLKKQVGIFDSKITQRGWIDETSLVSYNDKFYSYVSGKSKDIFIDYIENPDRHPDLLKIINISPYHWNKTGRMEVSMLDCLGSSGLKKRLGAFFSPIYAVEKSTEYLRKIISGISGDYVILDRCAGTGNLEQLLTEEELSHCVLNTIAFAELSALRGIYDGRVRKIIPNEDDTVDKDGLVDDGDALSKEFYGNLLPLLKDKTVIVLENPPYSEPQAEATRKGKTVKGTMNNYVTEEMKKSVKGKASTDLANKFIWSAFNIVKADYCVVYSPVKYFKTQHLVEKKFLDGAIVNREDFHATEAGISIMAWKNEDESTDEWHLENTLIKKVKNESLKNRPESDTEEISKMSETSGTPDFKHSAWTNLIPNKCGTITIVGQNNIKQAAPLFAANSYTCKGFLEKEIIMKSADKGLKYLEDGDFVKDCLIWIALTDKNKCVSTEDKKNQCCIRQATSLDGVIEEYPEKSRGLIGSWDYILSLIRGCEEYNPNFNYGLYQIEKDINKKIEQKLDNGEVAVNKKGEEIMVYKYKTLNSHISLLKKDLEEYYERYITPKLFEYELLK